MAATGKPVTRIARHTRDSIYVRDRNLVEDLIGKVSFTDMIYLHLIGQPPTRAQSVLLDAVLVTLMEHGLTPSAIATRMIAMSSPEALQAAVAAGLLGVGSQFIGTMENTALLLADLIAAPGGVQARARAVVAEHRRDHKPVPGFGHPLHRPDDPRSPKLIALARDQGVPGRHIAALEALAAAVDDGYGRHITINATGAVAAVLGEIAIPTEIMRGIAVISRAAGLVGHIREEREHPAARFIWELTEREVAYAGPSARPGPNDKEGD